MFAAAIIRENTRQAQPKHQVLGVAESNRGTSGRPLNLKAPPFHSPQDEGAGLADLHFR